MTDHVEVVVADDPKKPWKALGGVVAAEATYLLTQELVDFPTWVDLLLNAVLVGLAVFAIGNPKVRK